MDDLQARWRAWADARDRIGELVDIARSERNIEVSQTVYVSLERAELLTRSRFYRALERALDLEPPAGVLT